MNFTIGERDWWTRAFTDGPADQDTIACDIRLLVTASVLGPRADRGTRPLMQRPLAALAALANPGPLGTWARRTARRWLHEHGVITTIPLFGKGTIQLLCGGAVVSSHGARGAGRPEFNRAVPTWMPRWPRSKASILIPTLATIAQLPDALPWTQQYRSTWNGASSWRPSATR